METLVIALGGNALLKKGERPTFGIQMGNVRRTAARLADVLSDRDTGFVITHGNGPQVGDELIRNEYSRKVIPPLPLYVLNAETQALIGSMLESAITTELAKRKIKRKVCAVLTHVMVNAKDPAFRDPEKQVGPFYSKMELERQLGHGRFDYVKSQGRYRRVVPSPRAESVMEMDAVSELLHSGHIVICGGGGGIPMIKSSGRLIGADAVIDKDSTAQLIANSVGAKRMAILTDVDCLYGKDGRNEPIRRISAGALKGMLKGLEAGTMRPKAGACVDFIEGGGKRAYIGNLDKPGSVLSNETGTIVE
jgi:carbamate kinase